MHILLGYARGALSVFPLLTSQPLGVRVQRCTSLRNTLMTRISSYCGGEAALYTMCRTRVVAACQRCRAVTVTHANRQVALSSLQIHRQRRLAFTQATDTFRGFSMIQSSAWLLKVGTPSHYKPRSVVR